VAGRTAVVLHASKFLSQQRFPESEMRRQRGACLLVLIGRLNHDVAQRAAVRTLVQGDILNKGAAPAPRLRSATHVGPSPGSLLALSSSWCRTRSIGTAAQH
jgi:hypothetical protein